MTEAKSASVFVFLRNKLIVEHTESQIAIKFNVWYYIIAVAAILAVLVTKEVDYFLKPQFRLEDGYVFFADAFNLDWFHALIQPYAGYYQLLPRLVAQSSLLLPFAYIPLAFAASSLFFITLSLSWFALPYFRHVVSSDLLRLLFVTLLPITPNSSGQLLIAYLQWFLFVWCFLVSIMEFPKKKWIQSAIFVFYLITIPTVAVQVILVPIWIWRFIFTKSTFQRKWIVILLLANLAIILSVVYRSDTLSQWSASDLIVSFYDLVHSLIYKGFLLNVLGYRLTKLFFQKIGWPFFYVITLAFIVALCILIWKQRTRIRYTYLSFTFFYIIFSSLCFFYALRSRQLNYYFMTDPLTMIVHHSRYFWPASVSCLLLIWMWIDAYWRNPMTTLPVKLMLAIGIAGIFTVNTLEFRPSSWSTGNWRTYAKLLTYLTEESNVPKISRVLPTDLDAEGIQQLKEQQKQSMLSTINASPFSLLYPITNHQFPVRIPLLPASWSMNLFAFESPRTIQPLTADLMWLGYDQKIEPGLIKVDLFWQGNPWADASKNISYMASVDLVNHQHTQLARSSVSSLSKANNATDSFVFYTEHELYLPNNLPEDTYSLLIGLAQSGSTNDIKLETALLIENTVDFHR